MPSYIFGGVFLSVVTKPTLQQPFSSPIELVIPTKQLTDTTVRRVCVYYIPEDRRDSEVWGRSGCWVEGFNSTHTRCQCTHLTSFAVLMQTRDFEIPGIHVASLEVLTVIGCCISIASLTTTVALLLWFRLRSERYVLLMNLSVAVMMSQVVFISGIDAVQIETACRFVAILLHYLYLCVFTLMLAEGIHLYHKLHRAFYVDNSFNMLLILGWGAPFVVVALSLLTDADGYSTERHCWLSTDGTIWAFVGPALTIITVNVAILISIIRTFLTVTIVAKKTDLQKFKASIKATVVLLPLLGVTWMFGVVAVNSSTVVFQYIFAVLNSLQGLFIFLFHVVFNEDIRKACNKYNGRVVTNLNSLPETSQEEFDTNKIKAKAYQKLQEE